MSYNDARMKLENELNDAFMQSERRVHIVHGIGQGKLKAMAIDVVNGYDFCSPVSGEYILNPNPGVLLVDLFPPDQRTLRMYRA